MALPSKKRQRSVDLLEPLLARLLNEEAEEQALRLGHLALISDDPGNAVELSQHKRCKHLMDVCWATIGGSTLTSHDDSISILINLLVAPETRSEVFRGLAQLVREKESIQTLLQHVDMPALSHHVVKAVSRCGNVEDRDVAQACSLTAASMENPEDRVEFCKSIISTDGGDCFLLRLLDSWPREFGNGQLIETMDWFLSNPVDDLMWDAQTSSRQEFAKKWLTFLISQLLECGESTLSMQALGDTLQVRDTTFREVLLAQESLLDHLMSNLVVSVLTNREDHSKIRAAMYAALHLASPRKPTALGRLAGHARFDTLVALAVENMQLAVEEQEEVINVLTIFLQNEATEKAVLAGSNVKQIINSISHLLSVESASLLDSCLELLTTLLKSIDPGALLGAGDSLERLIPRLCGLEKGKDILLGLLPVLQWWPRYTQLMSLDFKRDWLADELQPSSEEAPAPVRLEVQREQLLESLCSGLVQCSASLCWGIDVSFTDDQEQDEDMEEEKEEEEESNQRQEFFRLAAMEFMSPDLGLFLSKDGGRSFHVAPAAKSAPLAQFELCGKLIGLALLHGEMVPSMRLSPALRKVLLGSSKLSIEDMAAVDPEFYEKRVCYILEGHYQQGEQPSELSDLGLTFEDELAGERVELCLGGAQRPVTEENKRQYLDLICHHRLLDSVRPQVDALVRGVRALVSVKIQQQLERTISPAELGLILCGVGDLDVHEWKEASQKAEETSPEVWETCWRAIEAMSPEQRNAVLEFVTGSSFLPEGGLKALKFTVAPARGEKPVVVPPTLHLPSCNSVEEMRHALVVAAHGYTA